MRIYKRDGIYYADYKIDGKRVRKSTQTSNKAEAQQFLVRHYTEDKRKSESIDRSWQEAAVRWLKETSYKKSHKDDIIRLRWFDNFLGNKLLKEINRDLIDEMTEARLADGVCNTTVNRYLELIRAILRRCRDDWEWIGHIPKVRMLPTAKRRVRWLTRVEAERLFATLPHHLEAMARFSVATGLRASNVLNLTWEQVDLSRRVAWIHHDQSKTGKSIPVPLNDEALGVLRGERFKHDEYVFTFRGRRIKQANTKAWRAALKRAGIEDFRWHDLRHTFASWHIQNGTPIHVLAELGGWSSEEMVKRYAHLSADHLIEYAKNISSPDHCATKNGTATRW